MCSGQARGDSSVRTNKRARIFGHVPRMDRYMGGEMCDLGWVIWDVRFGTELGQNPLCS
jgi:hypothetical protein